MTKFDEAVNDILAGKIEKAKKKKRKLQHKIRGKKGKPTAPNTPGNHPVSSESPAMRKGINKDYADTPMPLSVGV